MIIGEDAEAYGNLLHEQKGEIEGELGDDVQLDWKIPPDWTNATISTAVTGWNLHDRDQWTNQFDWFAKHLNEFDSALGARVRAMDPADYTPEESAEELDEPD